MDDLQLTTAVAERRSPQTVGQSDTRPASRAPTPSTRPAPAAATWTLQQVLDPSFWAQGWQDLQSTLLSQMQSSSASPPPSARSPSTATSAPQQQPQRRDPLNRFEFFAGAAPPRAPDATTWAQVRTAALPNDDDHSED